MSLRFNSSYHLSSLDRHFGVDPLQVKEENYLSAENHLAVIKIDPGDRKFLTLCGLQEVFRVD